MPKRAISVTLEAVNLLWLRGQAGGAGRRSVSEVVDRLVSEARTHGRVHEDAIRSVAGTIRIDASDPDLTGADVALRGLFPDQAGTGGARQQHRPARRRRTRA